MLKAAPSELPPHLAARMVAGPGAEPRQNLKEYHPEWARAFWTGSVSAGCDHARMLASVKCPVLFAHHYRKVDDEGWLLGAISDSQAERVRALVESAGQRVDYRSFPRMGHSMHGQDPDLFTATLAEWAQALPAV